ncbi:MAG: biotin/lipoate A/B protein ligase family protein [Acidobacteriota bacterium]
MAWDEALLLWLDREEASRGTCLRFYQWTRPTLSLGFSQKAVRAVNFAYCRQAGIDVVRRPTGGRAVLHDQELTYAVISNDDQLFPMRSIIETYRQVGSGLLAGLGELGLELDFAEGPSRRMGHRRLPASEACFAMSNHHEILHHGRKLVGSAQKRLRRAFLQHGSILLDFDSKAFAQATFGVSSADLDSRVTSLRQCLTQVPRVDEVIQCILRGFKKALGTTFEAGPLEAPWQDSARELARIKYRPLQQLEVSVPDSPLMRPLRKQALS